MAWRSALVDIINRYPVIRYKEDSTNSKSIFSITVLNHETNSTLTKSELEIIYEAMTMDLSGKFNLNEVNSGLSQADKKNLSLTSELND